MGNVLSACMSDIHRVYCISSDLIAKDFAQQEEPLFLAIQIVSENCPDFLSIHSVRALL